MAGMDTTNKIDWYRTPIDRETLKGLTAKSDVKGFFQAGGFLLVYLALGALAFWLFTIKLWIPMIISCYVFSMFTFFVSMAAAVHELSHGTAFRTKAYNEFFYNLFCFLTWNNPVHFRASHTFHHQLTVHRGLDKEVVLGPVREVLNWKHYIQWFTFDAELFVHWVGIMVRQALGNGDAEYFFWDPLFSKDDPRRRQMINFARVALIGHLVLLGLFIYFKLWVLIYLVNFGVFFAGFLGRACGAIQHQGLSPSVPDWRLSCHTVKLGPVLRFLYWNMNFHVEHHMYAAVPFCNLERLHKAIEHDLPKQHVGLLPTLRLLWGIKKRQKLDPAYLFEPGFPPTAAPPKRS